MTRRRPTPFVLLDGPHREHVHLVEAGPDGQRFVVRSAGIERVISSEAGSVATSTGAAYTLAPCAPRWTP